MEEKGTFAQNLLGIAKRVTRIVAEWRLNQRLEKESSPKTSFRGA
jgi:hypothetical protein